MRFLLDRLTRREPNTASHTQQVSGTAIPDPDFRFRESYSPASEPDVLRFEQRLDARLPEDYRRFLLTKNGGWPALDLVFPITDTQGGDASILSWLFALSDAAGEYGLEANLERMRGRLPANLLAIGEDPGGNQVCLSVAGDDYGKVYFWDHEQEAGEGESPGYRNVYPIATSFREFLSVLAESPGISGCPPKDCTWHHCPDRPGTMQLVLRAEHGHKGPLQAVFHPGGTGTHRRLLY